MNVVGHIKVDMKPINRILKEKGLTRGGDVQRFHTANVLRRIIKYMPYRTGATVKLTIAQTDVNGTLIVTKEPQAKYLYYGVAMEGKPPKVATDRPLNYTKTKNPLAGPKWDKALVAVEGDALRQDLQNYVDRRRTV